MRELPAWVAKALEDASADGTEYDFGNPVDWSEKDDGSVVVITSAGQKVVVAPDGTTEIVMGPGYAEPEVVEAEPLPEGPPPPLDPIEPGLTSATVSWPTEPTEVLLVPDPHAQVELELDRVERFQGEDGQWYFRGVARNGEVVYPSEGYADKRGAGNAGRALAKRFEVSFVEAES